MEEDIHVSTHPTFFPWSFSTVSKNAGKGLVMENDIHISTHPTFFPWILAVSIQCYSVTEGCGEGFSVRKKDIHISTHPTFCPWRFSTVKVTHRRMRGMV